MAVSQSQCGAQPERSDNGPGNSPHNMKTSASSSLAAAFALLLCAAVSGFDCAEHSFLFAKHYPGSTEHNFLAYLVTQPITIRCVQEACNSRMTEVEDGARGDLDNAVSQRYGHDGNRMRSLI